MPAARLVVITVDALDWGVFDQVCRSGLCPHLVSLRRRGIAVPLSGAAASGPAGVATLLSGFEPEVHGVWEALVPDGTAWHPVTRSAWAVPPVWERLADSGIDTGSVAMPASIPGDSWAGIHFDDSLPDASGMTAADWALPRRVAPASARQAIRDARFHPSDVTASMLLPLVPELAAIDQRRETRLPLLAVALARAATVQAAARRLLSVDGPRAVFVHHGWPSGLRLEFGSPAGPPWHHVLSGAWRLFDAMVGHLVTLAGPDSRVIVASPGWRGRPGVFCLAGPGVAVGMGFAMPALALAPLILRHFGLADTSMPGQVPPNLGPAPRLRPVARLAAARPGCPLPAGELAAIRATLLAMRGAMIVRRNPSAAAGMARAALTIAPDHPDALRLLAGALVLLDAPAELPDLAAVLRRAAPGRGWAPLAEAAALVLTDRSDRAAALLADAEREAAGDIETLLGIAATWLAARQPLGVERVMQRVLALDPGNIDARLGLVRTALARRDFAGVETILAGVLADDPGRAKAHADYATLCEQTGRRDEAQRRRATARQLDPTLR